MPVGGSRFARLLVIPLVLALGVWPAALALADRPLSNLPGLLLGGDPVVDGVANPFGASSSAVMPVPASRAIGNESRVFVVVIRSKV